jgi:ligand-binding sensor domain-containing protein
MKKTLGYLLTAMIFAFSGCDDNNDDNGNGLPAGLPGNKVSAIYITDDGLRYFATDKGIASFDGTEWTVYADNPKVTTGIIHDMDFELSAYGPEFWLGTNSGVNVVTLPIDATSGATTYTKENTQELFPGQPGLLGDSIFAVRVDRNNVRWYGTQEGLSAFSGNKWPQINMHGHYYANFFKINRVTSMDYSNDTVYIGTMGGGVARMVVNGPDAISGASPYEVPWSAIPSTNILAVFIDGNSQWYGSDDGLARHDGTQAMENWNLFYEEDGLVNNYVQSINKDLDGNLWFGTRGGVSKFDGATWTNYTAADGLVNNDVLCITIDKDGSVWFGTGNGASHYDGGTFTNYQATE